MDHRLKRSDNHAAQMPYGGATISRSRNRQGFTIVEFIIVCAIMATLVAIGIPAYSGYIEKARIVKAIGDIEMLQTALTEYELRTKRFPDSLSDIDRENLRDPWGSPYQYLNLSDLNGKGAARKDLFLVPLNSDYDLYSMGKDGASQGPLTAKVSRDDIIRANDGGYIGLAAHY
jgi:general secretion pathway protein G